MRINPYREQRFTDKLMGSNYCCQMHMSEPEGLYLLFESDRQEISPYIGPVQGLQSCLYEAPCIWVRLAWGSGRYPESTMWAEKS